MMINEIGNISNKNFSLSNVQGSNQGSIQRNNISGSSSSGSGSLIRTDKISGQPNSDINIQNIKLKEACTQFEQIFIKYMVDKMWGSTNVTGGKQSIEKSVWQDYFNSEISKVIAESHMTGISETLFGQLGTALQTEDGAVADMGEGIITSTDIITGEGEGTDTGAPYTENEDSMDTDKNINI